MKRIIVYFLSIIVFVIVFSSCSAYERCPAYGHYSQQVIDSTIDEEKL